ncbi:MAG: phosphatase PAP2 family protein [Acidimicrobiales bacterium]
MDTRWYLDINRWARSTPWAHGFMHAYALWAGVVLLAVLLVAGWWRSRMDDHVAVAGALWAGFGTLAAVGINQPVSHLVGRVRPYYTLHHVEVLVPRANDFTFPSDHATAAGAVICGLLLARRTRLAAVAAVLGLFLAFARVYVGAHYPGDVAGGLVLGAVVVALLRPIAMRILLPLVDLLARSPLRGLVAARSSGEAAPANRPPGRASEAPAEAH